MSDSTQPILDRVAGFFTLEEWPFEPVDGQTILHLTYRDEHAEFDCYAQSLEAEQQFLFYSLAPFMVPDDRMAATSELITRINYGLPIGNFELNHHGGELRYKTSIDLGAEELTHSMIEPVVGANLSVMRMYLPGLRAVVFADASPAAVVAELEG